MQKDGEKKVLSAAMVKGADKKGKAKAELIQAALEEAERSLAAEANGTAEV